MLEITMSELIEESSEVSVDQSGSNTVLYVSCGAGALAVGGAIWWFSGNKLKYNGKELTDELDKILLNNKKDLGVFSPDAKVYFNFSSSTIVFKENFFSCSITFEGTDEDIPKNIFLDELDEADKNKDFSCKKSALKSGHTKIINDRIAAIYKENAKILEERKKNAEEHESPVKVEFMVNFNKDNLNKDIAHFHLNDKKELKFYIDDRKNEIQNIFSFDILGYMMSKITIPEDDIGEYNSLVFYEDNQDIKFMHTTGLYKYEEKSSGVVDCSVLLRDIMFKLLFPYEPQDTKPKDFSKSLKYNGKDSSGEKAISDFLFGCRSISKQEFEKLVKVKSDETKDMPSTE
jgi:hypothetical protein